MVQTKIKTRIITQVAIITLALGSLAVAGVALTKKSIPCTCSTGYNNCSGICANFQNDANNCGKCGNKCSSGNVCKKGKCLNITCKDSDGGKDFTKKGTVTVTSLEELKVSLQDDSSQLDEVTQALDAAGVGQGAGTKTLTDKCTTSYLNQGTYWSSDKPVLAEFSCNGIKPKVIYHDCSSEKKACEDGACVLKCKNNQTDCNDKCVDTKNDNNNCGACGKACSSNESCSKGTCVLGIIACSGQDIRQCNNKCVNIKTNRNNCGTCGNECATGTSCKSGICAK